MRIDRLRWTLTLAAAIAGSWVAPCCAVELIGYLPDYRMTSTSYVNNVLPAQLAHARRGALLRHHRDGFRSADDDRDRPGQHQHDPTEDQPVAEADRPRLDITFGGAGEAASFAAVAQSSSLRTQLAQNINALLNQTGAVGVDIDWEHPAEGAELTRTTRRCCRRSSRSSAPHAACTPPSRRRRCCRGRCSKAPTPSTASRS